MVGLATFLEPAWSIRERQREFRGWLGVGNDSEGGFAWLSWQPSSNRRGRSESAGESFVGGWAWGAKTSSTESVVELVSGEPRRREPAGFSRFGQ